LLGAACVVNGTTGLLLAGLPYEVFGVIDSLLKLGVGLSVVLTKPGP
jgi:hypothetical protein